MDDEFSRLASPALAPPFDERIYTVKEVGRILGLSDNAVIKLFEREPGVRDLAEAKYLGKRRRMLRIPHSVLVRVWNRSEVRLNQSQARRTISSS